MVLSSLPSHHNHAFNSFCTTVYKNNNILYIDKKVYTISEINDITLYIVTIFIA